jgi:hypothetical protein
MKRGVREGHGGTSVGDISHYKKQWGGGKRGSSAGSLMEKSPLALILVRTILGQNKPEKYGQDRTIDGTFNPFCSCSPDLIRRGGQEIREGMQLTASLFVKF